MPKPMLDDREYAGLDELTVRYEKLTTPGPIARTAKKVTAIVAAGVKDAVAQIGNTVSEQEIYEQALKLIGDGFKVLKEQAAKITVSEESVIKGVNAVSKAADVESLEEVCRIRAYDVSKAANKKDVQLRSTCTISALRYSARLKAIPNTTKLGNGLAGSIRPPLTRGFTSSSDSQRLFKSHEVIYA